MSRFYTNPYYAMKVPQYDSYYLAHRGNGNRGAIARSAMCHDNFSSECRRNADVRGAFCACNRCGGDYVSVAPKRDRYYQYFQGYMGTDLLSGYPYYKAY